MSDVYTCDPFKNPKMGVSIVDALTTLNAVKKTCKIKFE